MSSTEGFLRHIAEYHLSISLYDNARFYAERLYYESPSPDHLHLLAQCYFREGKIKQTYLLLQECPSSQNRYLFALACIRLRKYQEAERALCPSLYLDPHKLTQKIVSAIPGQAAGLYLLGIICKHENRKPSATAYFQKCLQYEPTMWSAITELSDLGVRLDLKKLFRVDAETAIEACMKSSSSHTMGNIPVSSNGETLSKKDTPIQLSQQVPSAPGTAASSLSNSVGPSAMSSNAKSAASVPLGHSAISMHYPFASPGTINSPAAMSSMHPMQSVEYSPDMSVHGVAQSAISLPPRGANSSIGPSKLFNSTLGDDSVALRGADPRKLFDMSTPGLTPIAGRSQMDTRMDTTSDEIGLGDVSLAQSIVQSNQRARTRGADDALIPGSSLVGGSERRPKDTTGRRVSFGPTARLSFSAMSVEPEGDLETNAAGDDEYPQKVFRMGSGGPGNDVGVGMSNSVSVSGMSCVDNDISTMVSPIAGDKGTPAVNLSNTINMTETTPAFMMSTRRSEKFIDKSMERGSKHENGGVDSTTEVQEGQVYGKNPAEVSVDMRDGVSDKLKFEMNGSLFGDRDENLNMNAGLGKEAPHRDEEGGSNTGKRAQNEHVSGNKTVPESSADSSSRRNNKQSRGSSSHKEKVVSATVESASLLYVLAAAYQALKHFQCKSCIELLHCLPDRHQQSGFVQQILGTAYYEMCDYKPSLLTLKEMLRIEPFRVKGTEVLSTVLWHLKKDVELCALAQQVAEVDKFAPETWCVVGNCFSQQREPDVAIRYFQRALQVDPSFTYAHTLYGHELVSNEDLEKAIGCFRTAVLQDDRHYNAWYGLGSIYHRQEKHELAEYHFRRAVEVNNVSSVLKCFLAMVLHAQGNEEKTREALSLLAEASEADPKNPQLHFQKAHILYATAMAEGASTENSGNTLYPVETFLGMTTLELLEEGLKSLELVRVLAPREPPVYAMLGQIYQRLGRSHEAVRSYIIAIDLDPKEAASLKAALDSL